jgi:predicted RNase H-like nuclease (RuvC/YqgF family)
MNNHLLRIWREHTQALEREQVRQETAGQYEKALENREKAISKLETENESLKIELENLKKSLPETEKSE